MAALLYNAAGAPTSKWRVAAPQVAPRAAPPDIQCRILSEVGKMSGYVKRRLAGLRAGLSGPKTVVEPTKAAEEEQKCLEELHTFNSLLCCTSLLLFCYI